jgi:hypothetical protein
MFIILIFLILKLIVYYAILYAKNVPISIYAKIGSKLYVIFGRILLILHQNITYNIGIKLS